MNLFTNNKPEGYKGKITIFYENGKIRTFIEYYGCKKHGYHKEWYPNGQILSSTMYWLDEKHGYHMEWYPNGVLRKCKFY